MTLPGFAETVGAAAATVRLAKLLQDISYAIRCEIVIRNESEYWLSRTVSCLLQGTFLDMPTPIKGTTTSAPVVACCRCPVFPTGSAGYASWLIEGESRRRLEIVWSVPGFGKNMLGIRLTDDEDEELQKAVADTSNLRKMLSEKFEKKVKYREFTRKAVIRSVFVEENGLTVEGTMSLGRIAKVEILIRTCTDTAEETEKCSNSHTAVETEDCSHTDIVVDKEDRSHTDTVVETEDCSHTYIVVEAEDCFSTGTAIEQEDCSRTGIVVETKECSHTGVAIEQKAAPTLALRWKQKNAPTLALR